jgi:hypothetical protein
MEAKFQITALRREMRSKNLVPAMVWQEDEIRQMIREEIAEDKKCQSTNTNVQDVNSNLNSSESTQIPTDPQSAKTAGIRQKDASRFRTSEPTQVSSQPDASTQEFASMVTTGSKDEKTGSDV